MKNEVWKDIPGYEGEYQASTMGRIKSIKRTVVGKNWYTGKQFYRTVPERILKPGRYCKCGHVSVILRNPHKISHLDRSNSAKLSLDHVAAGRCALAADVHDCSP